MKQTDNNDTVKSKKKSKKVASSDSNKKKFLLDDMLLPYQKRFCNNPASKKIFLKARQIGGSFCIAYCCVKKAVRESNTTSLILSTGERAAQELLKKCLQWAQAVEIMSDGKMKWTSNANEVKFNNGSRIISIPSGNVNSARGYTVTGVLAIDEAGYIDNFEDLWQSVIPTMTSRLRNVCPLLILASTPSNKNSLFGKIWFDLFNDFAKFKVTIDDAIADGLKVDINELHKLFPDEKRFECEFMCKWQEASNDLIDVNLLQGISDCPPCQLYFMGVDFGRFKDSTSIAIIGRLNDKVYLADLVILNNIEYAKQLETIKQVYAKWNPVAGYGDAGGLGSPLCEELNRTMSAKFNGIQFNLKNKVEMYENFRKRIFERSFFVKNDYFDSIKQDILLIRLIVSDNGKVSYVASRYNNSHADNMTAVVLALNAEKMNQGDTFMPTYIPFLSSFGRYVRRI